jgi:paraquat-inducible protein B
LIGGIVFDTPLTAGPGTQAAAGTSFPLYPSQASVTEATFTEAIPYLAQFDGSVRGLRPGAPVEFRGMRIGTVRSVSLEIDATAEAVRIPVVFEIEPQRVKLIGGERMVPGKLMEALVRRGLRAQLKSGNLLTGELLIDLDFHHEAPPAEVAVDGPYPTIPTVPSELDVLAASVQGILGKLAALPLEGLIEDTQKAIRNVDALVTSPDTQATLKSLRQSAQDLQALVASVEQRTGPVLGRAEATLTAAEGLIGANSQLRYDLGALLRELTSAARSIRVFADYLERHPEALVRGKGNP